MGFINRWFPFIRYIFLSVLFVSIMRIWGKGHKSWCLTSPSFRTDLLCFWNCFQQSKYWSIAFFKVITSIIIITYATLYIFIKAWKKTLVSFCFVFFVFVCQGETHLAVNTSRFTSGRTFRIYSWKFLGNHMGCRGLNQGQYPPAHCTISQVS